MDSIENKVILCLHASFKIKQNAMHFCGRLDHFGTLKSTLFHLDVSIIPVVFKNWCNFSNNVIYFIKHFSEFCMVSFTVKKYSLFFESKRYYAK